MMLFVDGTNMGIFCRDISFWVKNHESAFDLLNQLVGEEWVLERATIVDGLDRISLPVQAFDGQSITFHITAMQRQWQQILARQPLVIYPVDEKNIISWLHQLDSYYDDLMTHLQKMVLLLEMRKANLGKRANDTFRPRINEQIESLIEINERMFRETKRYQQQNRKRLSKLENK
jgi:hypothetical protein